MSASTPAPTLLAQRDGPVLTLTLNRPDALNSMTAQLRSEFCAALDRADADDEVRAIIVTGAGRAFCAGADLSRGASTFDKIGQAPEFGEHARERDGGGVLALRLFACKKPLIAAVNGAAVGIGATMVLPMDIRIASSEARFGYVFARRGIVPDACASWFLPRVVGIARALQWTMSGRVFPAAEALASGLVSEVCEPQLLLTRARAIALEIAENAAPVSIALTRQMLWRMLGASHPMEAHRLESRAIAARGKSGDAQEGVRAFLEKRTARFPGLVSRDMPDCQPWWRDPPYS